MFRSLLGNRGDFKNFLLRMPIGSQDRSDFRSSESQCAGLVEDHGVHRTQEFEVQPTFDDCTFLRNEPESPENSQRSSGRDSASAGNNDDGYGRGQIASDDECQDSTAERKPNEIPCKSVCSLLNWGT